MNFQVPIHYGAFTVPDQYEPGFHTVWPEVGLADTQGGMVRVRMPVGRLNHLTAASGADVVRAHRVPDDLRGDLLITEPVGRLIRRARIVKNEGLTQLRNAYPGSEFILSTDPLFRPINITTGARRLGLHRRHVPRHHPGGELDAPRLVPAAEDRAVSARQGHHPRPDLAAALRRRAGGAGDAGRPGGAGDAGDSGAAGAAARPDAAADARARRRRSSSRIWAIRTAGGATPRSSCSCCGRTSRSCPRSRTIVTRVGQPGGALPRALDARRAGRARRRRSSASR